MRSALFVPGDDEKKLAKALLSGADALIVDLEDSVAFAAKERARRIAGEFLRAAASQPSRPRLFVRVNPLESGLNGPLQSLPKDFIDINFAFSRTPGSPKRYVQDLMRERASDLALLLDDPNAHFYVCGLKSMEEGVVLALRDVAQDAGLVWDAIGAALKREGRLHLETY